MARNFSLLRSKRFWILLITGIAGLFILILFSQPKEQPPNLRSLFPGEITDGVASFLYRYDTKEKTYVPENSEGWEDKDFVRYVFDVEQGLTITDCIYFIYDAKRGETRVLKTRECNKPITVSVGQESACSSQGEVACLLYVYATASDETTGRVDIGDYSIDYDVPVVSKVFVKEGQEYPILAKPGEELTFMVTVSDNEAVAGCWLYANGDVVGTMEFSCEGKAICRAQRNHILSEAQEHYAFFAKCADHYDQEQEGYLNVGRGEIAEVVVMVNHSPEIVSCRVTPPQGTKDTRFSFEVDAIDSDGEQLQYQWEFGDGTVSAQQKSSHSFSRGGVYTPKVTIIDNVGEKQECFTAWVVIQ